MHCHCLDQMQSVVENPGGSRAADGNNLRSLKLLMHHFVLFEACEATNLT